MTRALKLLAVFATLAALAMPAAKPAEARVFVGVGVGVPVYGPSYYGPPYYGPAYYPPPVVYAPPPVYYAPPPPVVVYTPPPPVYVAPAPAAAPPANCRTFNGDATIDASGKPFYGTACQSSDGRWHIQ